MKCAIGGVVFSLLALICFIFYFIVYPPYVDAAGVVHELFYLCAIGVISMMLSVGCIVATLARRIQHPPGAKPH